MKKRIWSFLTAFLFVVLISLNFVSSQLCLGSDGYYRDCNYVKPYYREYNNPYSQRVYDSGFNDGYIYGYERGYGKGYENGYDYGYYSRLRGYGKGYNYRDNYDSRVLDILYYSAPARDYPSYYVYYYSYR